jgi:hypothetical protein
MHHTRMQQDWIFYFFLNCSDANKYKFRSHANPSSAQYILWTYTCFSALHTSDLMIPQSIEVLQIWINLQPSNTCYDIKLT